jgi:hypothetical protein
MAILQQCNPVHVPGFGISGDMSGCGVNKDGYVELDQNNLTPEGAATQVNDGWAACRNSPTGSYSQSNHYYDTDAVSVRKWTSLGAGRFKIIRGFFVFGLPTNECAESAYLNIYGRSNENADIIVVKATEPYLTVACKEANDDAQAETSLSTSSFNAIHGWKPNFTPSDLTTYSSAFTDFQANQYNQIPLNSTAIRDINKGPGLPNPEGSSDYCFNLFRVCIMEYNHDYLNVEPFTGATNGDYVNGWYWQWGFLGHDPPNLTTMPYWPGLVVNGKEVPCGYYNKVNGVSFADIGTVSGIETADIDKVVGTDD